MKFTGSLIVCTVAAAFSAGALLLDPDPSPIAAPSPASAPSAPAAAPVISIQGFAFTSVTATPGATVTVQNLDETDHTVSSAVGLFDSGVIAAKGASSFLAPTEPGTYSFVCAIHPSMVGQLVVVSS